MLGIGIAVIKIIVKIITMQSLEDIGPRNRLRTFSTNMNDRINLNFFAGFIDATQLDIYMSCFVNFQTFKGESTFANVNFGLCLFVMFTYLWLLLTSLFISTRVHTVERVKLEPGYVKYYDQWWWMKDGLKINSTFARHHVSIMYLRDPLMAACLVFGHDMPQVQIWGVVLMNLTCFILYSYEQPFKDGRENLVEIVNYFLFTAACACFGILTLGFDLTERFKYNYIGWTAIGVFVILLFFNFIFIL